jgi:PPP family 3-phenylpropionic acid transporter
MTGYFRGDAEAVLTLQDGTKFDTVTYSYYAVPGSAAWSPMHVESGPARTSDFPLSGTILNQEDAAKNESTTNESTTIAQSSAMRSSMSPLLAFILLYAAMYGAFGVASPFWPRFFEARGLAPEQLGLLLALGMLMRWMSGPLIGRLADIVGALRAVLGACTALAAGAALGLLLAEGFWALLFVHLGQAVALAPTTTLADALAVNAARPRNGRKGFEYGWVRGAASAAFMIGTLSAGQLVGYTDVSSIVWMHAALLTAAVLAAALVPRLEAQPVHQTNRPFSFAAGLRELWTIRIFRFVIIVAALVYGSHAMHDAFAVIRWNQAGISPGMTSVLWSEAVAAEVLMFLVIGPALVDRLGTQGAAALAAIAGVVRWIVMAQTTSGIALAIVQPLHGFTFALLHLACMRLIGMVVPAHLAATAQALYAFGAGVATAALILLSGQLYAEFGGAAFLLMALLCALALPLSWFRLRQPNQ